MNERIEELAEQCVTRKFFLDSGCEEFDYEKFAELLLLDCRDMFVVNSPSWNLLNEKLEHFGVEE